jgi:hypothetical protein
MTEPNDNDAERSASAKLAATLDQATANCWAVTVRSVMEQGHEAEVLAGLLAACRADYCRHRERVRQAAIAVMREHGLRPSDDFGLSPSTDAIFTVPPTTRH